MSKKKLPDRIQVWIDARKRHKLSDAHVQMARELGLNPKKLGSIDNHHQESWKAPLAACIEELYEERFGRERPEAVLSLEEIARIQAQKKEGRKEARRLRRLEDAAPPDTKGGENPPVGGSQ